MSKPADQGEAAPAGDPSATDPSATLDPFERVVPSWTDPTVRRASQLIGGPLGRHAQVGRLLVLTPLRVCLLMALLFLIFGWLAKSPCIQQTPGPNGTFVLDSSANRQWISGCYNDVVPAYQIHGLNQSISPFATHYASDGTVMPSLPYSALTAAFMWLVARMAGAYLKLADSTGLLPTPLDVGAFFTLGAITLGLIYLWAVASTLKISWRRPWDTAIMCLSPLLVVHAFTNWDILPIALLAAAMLSWSRSRPVGAGVFLGLAIAAKLYPILFLIPLVVLALRTGKVRPVLVTTAAAVAAWLAVNLPFILTDPTAWSQFYATNVDRKPEFTTLWSVFSSWSGSTLLTPDLAAGQAPELLNAIVAVLLVVAVLLIGWLGLSVRRRPRVAQLMFLTVASFLLITKTWNPQFSLWLLPLAVLALPRWRPLLVWQLAEAALWWLLMLTFGTRGDSTARYALISAYPFQTMALVRDGIVLMLMVMVVREMLRPATDPVRQTGDDDPTGGVFDTAPDRFTLVSLPAALGFGRAREAPGEWQPAEPR